MIGGTGAWAFIREIFPHDSGQDEARQLPETINPRSPSRNSKRIENRATTAIERLKFCHSQAPMRMIYLDLSVSALKKCNTNPHHRSTIEEKHCVAQQPPSQAGLSIAGFSTRPVHGFPRFAQSSTASGPSRVFCSNPPRTSDVS
jgi:hypothetical protein